MPNFISEDHIEQALVQQLQILHGFDSLNCHTVDPEDLNDGSNRTNKRDVILVDRLREAATRLNPILPAKAIEDALERLTDRRLAMSLLAANEEVYHLIRDGIPVEFDDANGRREQGRVKVIDFTAPANNDFLAVTQLWIQGTRGFRRPDVLLYVNGLPLVFTELKNSNVSLRHAYDDNLTNYRAEIPQLFHTNAFCVLSNALETRVGSVTAEWEHFFQWLRVDDEKEKIDRADIRAKGTSVERVIEGLIKPERLLDFCENFILYHRGTSKIIAQNHQFIGVNRAYERFLVVRAAATATLTPALSQGERERTPHYRGGYDFSGLVKRARELRQSQTKAEDLLWELLRNRQFLGLKCRRQHQIGDYIVDFYYHEHRLVIEADGDVHQTPKQQAHDSQRDAILRGQGFQVLRLSNHDILVNTSQALESIASNLPSPTGRGAGGEGKTPRPGNGLGVFWHTQGSGKSFSMIFYARKIFRKAGIHYTFVIITDRDDLDRQIYKNFLDTGTVSKAEAAQPKDSAEMRKMLGQNKRLVFTLIHKFRWDRGKQYPALSDRDDIIVIVDEAHRTQYKGLAENLRAGLKNASYLAFTGTPLLGRDKKTEQWFGSYVSEYNFVQSVDDGATLPLFYEKRVPEMQNQNQELGDDFYELLDEANLDDLQQAKLEKKFATELEVIRRPARLDRIAADIVHHLPRRGYLGKAVVISLDKVTAVRMFDRVERLWNEAIKELTGQASKAVGDHKANLKKRLEWMKRVEMAVVVSDEAEEEKKFTEAGLNIARHRLRMNQIDANGHDVEFNFKDPAHPLQLVFVCAMWLTGFDAPTVSTLYLDKPQKDHTLMQTIARANRVTAWKIGGVEKKNGEIIDYYGVFRNMKKALKDYAQGPGEDSPVQEKTALLKLLDDAILEGVAYCRTKGIVIDGLLESQDVFKKLGDFQRHADTLISKDEWRKGFAIHENTITSLYEACKPEVLGNPVVRKVAVFQYLRGIIDAIIEQQDLDAVSKKIGELLDASVVVDESHAPQVAEGEAMPAFAIIQRGKTWDLSKIDFDKLKAEFKQATYRNIEIADLRAFLEKKLEAMLKVNSTRKDFAQRMQEIINRYNAGGASNESYFEELVKFTKELKAEDERHTREGLTEDELELFDLLKKEKMTQAEEQAVKLAAKNLLARLKEGTPRVLVQDWFKDSQSQKQVRSTVEEVLHGQLPATYDRAIFTEKCNRVFELMIDYACHGRKWAA